MTRRLCSLDPLRRRTLEAAVRRILPSEDGVGAAETGVAGYIESALSEAALEAVRPGVEEGLDGLDSLARERFGRAFARCPAPAQDDLLAHLEGNAEPGPRAFLRRLVLLTLEAFLCDPRRGGNRGGLGWSYIEYPPDTADPVPGQRGET
jgi:hypothetical protein